MFEIFFFFFFFNDTATTEIYTLSLHDALPIFDRLIPRMDDRTGVVHPPSLFDEWTLETAERFGGLTRSRRAARPEPEVRCVDGGQMCRPMSCRHSRMAGGRVGRSE